jgi:hypothetical protein
MLLAARVLFVILLGITWICTLGELVMSEIALCIAPDPSPGCADSNHPLTTRNALWLGPVFVGGPLIAAAAWTVLTPRGRRNAPACVLFGVIWLCAAPTLFLDAHTGAAACAEGLERHCGPATPTANVLKEIAASVGLIGGPAAIAAIAYRTGRNKLGRACAIAAIAAAVFVLAKTAVAIFF